MFIDFFYRLRAKKIPVSTSELVDLLKATSSLSKLNGQISVKEFYSISRNCLVKDIRFFDDFDIVFTECFKTHISEYNDIFPLLEEWLNKSIEKELSEKEKQNAKELSFEDVWKKLEERLKDQKEKHDGGNKWIGTKGTSPFGNSGFNPNGVRVGGGSGGGSAFDVIGERKYKDYRTDEALNIRLIKVALKKLKNLRKEGRLELSLDKTIKATSQNGGDLEIIFEKERKNRLKLLLLMDVGGSMTPHAERVSKLFSAAHQLNHFQSFHYYYFHNIVYDTVYESADFQVKIKISDLYKKYPRDTKVIFVGDASMHSYEFFQKTGMFDYYGYKYLKAKADSTKIKTGQQRLAELKEYFNSSIWLNPEPKKYWYHETIEAVGDIVPMYFLSVEGLTQGIKSLLR
jgi:hypothetical protein